jgi:hypothetical protein
VDSAGTPFACLRRCVLSQDHAFDIALIYLDEPIGNDLGFFPAGYDCSVHDYDMALLGYPGPFLMWKNPGLGRHDSLHAAGHLAYRCMTC